MRGTSFNLYTVRTTICHVWELIRASSFLLRLPSPGLPNLYHPSKVCRDNACGAKFERNGPDRC